MPDYRRQKSFFLAPLPPALIVLPPPSNHLFPSVLPTPFQPSPFLAFGRTMGKRFIILSPRPTGVRDGPWGPPSRPSSSSLPRNHRRKCCTSFNALRAALPYEVIPFSARGRSPPPLLFDTASQTIHGSIRRSSQQIFFVLAPAETKLASFHVPPPPARPCGGWKALSSRFPTHHHHVSLNPTPV